VDKPILSETILKTGVPINILRAHVNSTKGELIVEILGKKEAKKVIKELKTRGVEVYDIAKAIVLNEKKCLHCGACYSLCPTNAICIDRKKDWSVSINEKGCIGCGVCVPSCPTRAIEMRA
jgi:Pyruvate/2-oxoacid:ferredoxin oxidoreductase delta subunit